MKSFVHGDRGSSPGGAGYLVWNGGQWNDSVSLTRVDPTAKWVPGEIQDGYEKAQDGWPPMLASLFFRPAYP